MLVLQVLAPFVGEIAEPHTEFSVPRRLLRGPSAPATTARSAPGPLPRSACSSFRRHGGQLPARPRGHTYLARRRDARDLAQR